MDLKEYINYFSVYRVYKIGYKTTLDPTDFYCTEKKKNIFCIP